MTAGLVVGVDGVVASGKTTLVRELTSRLGAVLVPEYAPHPGVGPGVAPPADVPSGWRVQRHYLVEEERRGRAVGPGTTAVLDRTVLSQAAHVDAVHRTGGPDLRSRLADWLARGRAVEPDVVVTLTGERDASRERCAVREAGPDRHGTADLYVDEEYQRAFDAFLGRLAERLPDRVVVFPPCPEPRAVADRVLSRSARRRPPRLVTALVDELWC
ncbi:hypothetical protein [Umezawaea sp.]|uniref:hypothetical protein n=1 Tax=Umezawaea sp. TaxID=1955258 RepID=UPI002ED595BC